MNHLLDLGFVALTDAAPLIVAHERGLFAEEGLNVALHREVSWATIRDKVAAGLYQGAHMLAPMVIAANAGIGSEPARLIAPMSLNAHGAAIGVSAALAAEMAARYPADPRSAKALATTLAARRDHALSTVAFATVFPYSMHTYMLRLWAASAGLDPDRDIRIVTAAPTAMTERLGAGKIDGFCVGAPWGALCERQNGARIVLEAGEFWPGGPDKVLGLSEAWAARETNAALALVRAVLRAALWADAPENAGALVNMLSDQRYLDAPTELIAAHPGGSGTDLRFARDSAAFPWRSHARWIARQMIRWGQAAPNADLEAMAACYRPDLFRAAAADLDFPAPLANTLFDGSTFDPESKGG